MKLKIQYFLHLMWRTDIGKHPDDGKDWRQKEKRAAEDEMVGWHHWLMDMSLSKHLAGVHGVTKSQTWVSDWTKTVLFKSSCSVLFKSCMIHHIRDGVERGAGGTKCWIPFSQFKFLLNFKISQVLHNLIELLTIFGFVRKCSTLCFLTRWQGPIKLMRLTKVFPLADDRLY